jgi:hypothetical protein
MPTRNDIIAALSQQLEALKAARLEEIKAKQPQVVVHNEPVDYERIVTLLAEVVGRFRDEVAPADHTHHWEELEGKPTAFPPGEHSHQEIADLQAYADSISRHVEDLASTYVSWEDIQGKPETFTPAEHTHSELQALLDLLYEQGKPGDVLVQGSNEPAWKRLNVPQPQPPTIVRGGGGPVFPYFDTGPIPAGHYAVVAGEVTSTGVIDIEGVLVCL